MKELLYIVRLTTLSLILALLLAMTSVVAQNVVYQGDTSTLAVEQKPGDTYEWELYDNGTVNFATVPGNCPATSAIFVGGNAGASIQVQWLKPGLYFFKVTARNANGCTNNLKIGMMQVKEALPTARIISADPQLVCIGETATLEVELTGKGPWDLTFTDGTTNTIVTGITDSKYLFKVSPKVSTVYWVTEVKDQNSTNPADSNSVLVIVSPKPVSSPIYQHDP